jgi:hypothetical protein
MARLTKKDLRTIILNKMEKIVGEEAIFSKNDYMTSGMLSRHDDPGREMYSKCEQCGSKMYEVDKVCEQCGSMNEGACGEFIEHDMNDDFAADDVKIGNHKHYKGSYMAKSHLYKVNKYAEKLYHMIPDGHNLEDWMRTKIAQIADDIGEVYHALDHDKFEGDI